MTDLLAVDIPQFNGGLNTFATDDTVAPNQSSELENMILNPRYNALEQIGGTTWVAGIGAQDSTDFQIVSVFRFYLSGGTSYNLVHFLDIPGPAAGYVNFQVHDDQWNALVQVRPTGDFLDAPITDWAVYQNNVYFVCGSDRVFSWDGVVTNTTGSQGLMPAISFSPTLIEMYNGRAYYAGDTAQPSRLIASRPGTPTTFDSPFVEPLYDINNSDGDKITSLAVLGGNLIVFKENSFHIVQGSLPRRITQHPSVGIGAIHNSTVQKTPVGLVFLSKKGVYAYNGAQLTLLSGNITGDLRFLTGRADTRFSSAFHNNTYYLFYKPTSKEYINEGYSFDLLGLEYGEQIIPVGKLNNIRHGGSVVYTGANENNEWYMFLDFESNAVVRMLNSAQKDFYVDSGTTIDVDPFINTRWIDMGNRSITKEIRVIYIYSHQFVNGGTIDIEVDLDGVNGTTTHTLPTVAGNVYGAAVYGTGVYEGGRGYRYKVTLPTGIFCNRMRVKFYAEATTVFLNIDRMRIHYLPLREI